MNHLVLITIAFLVTSIAEAKSIAKVRHVTRAKIIESNSVATRPGSVYDNTTVFELQPGVRPQFMYEFIDTGLGTAEPLYPHFQKGFQASWFQLFPAWFSEKNRHIDHFSSVVTPEGCRQDALYALRHISEFPDHMFRKERAEGYDKAVVRFEYYTRLKPGAECGRHRSHDPDPRFTKKKLFKLFKKYRNVKSIFEIPKDFRDRIETRVAVVYHLKETRPCRNCKVDRSGFDNNSLWYYPNSHAVDYGYDDQHMFATIQTALQAKDLVIPASPALRKMFPLQAVLSNEEWMKIHDFLNGKPVEGFDPSREPGKDTLNIAEVTNRNIFTSGREVIPIENVYEVVENPANFKLVGVLLKPFATSEHPNFDHLAYIPQIRLVYQLHDAQNDKDLEQLFFHLNYDVVNRRGSESEQRRQHLAFLERIAFLAQSRKFEGQDISDYLLASLLQDFARPGASEDISISSSLTGIWVFGRLTRSYDGVLRPLRIVRQGIDVGYYSSVYDTDLFTDPKFLERFELSTYRDPKRLDVHNINFRTVTCAQCHHLSGRDAVHFSVNDKIDSRFTYPVRGTEFLYKDSNRMLREGVERGF